MTENGRAAMLMTLSMALFALEDAFIKQLSVGVPVYQILGMLGVFGLIMFWTRLAWRGQRMWTASMLHPMVIARNLGEVVGALGFVTALASGELASASAILQVMPLTLVLGGALFLGEQVGWRRWMSVILGFAGVLMILRPGTDAFQLAALWALLGVAGLTMRDLATRRVPADVQSDQLSAAAYGSMVPAGLLVAIFASKSPVVLDSTEWGFFAATVIVGVVAYALLVTATRLGEASAVAPFRYTRLGFALIVAVVVFGERPDWPTLAGAAVIAASGGYAMWREAKLRRKTPLPDGVIRPGES